MRLGRFFQDPLRRPCVWRIANSLSILEFAMHSREHLVEHAPERPDIGPLINRLPARLLRAHVGDRAHHHARTLGRRGHRRRLRQIRTCPLGAKDFGKPEVEHFHDALGRDLDVGRLEIAVNDAFLVGGLKRLRDLPRDRQRLSGGHRPASHAIGQRLSFYQLQHQRAHSRRSGTWRRVAFFEAVDRADVGMIQRASIRASRSKRVSRSGSAGKTPEHLDGDVAPELRIAGTIHLAHPPGADHPLDAVRPHHGARFEPPALVEGSAHRLGTETAGVVVGVEHRVNLVA